MDQSSDSYHFQQPLVYDRRDATITDRRETPAFPQMQSFHPVLRAKSAKSSDATRSVSVHKRKDTFSLPQLSRTRGAVSMHSVLQTQHSQQRQIDHHKNRKRKP